MRFLSPISRCGSVVLLAASGTPKAAETADGADWSVHGQSTYIDQAHPKFFAAYSGENSLDSDAENSHTITATIFLGRERGFISIPN